MRVYILGRNLTEDEVQEFLKEYYAVAYGIADAPQYRNMQIPDDIRQNIAWNALFRAVKTFDTDKGVSFKNYLWQLIKNDLFSEYSKIRKQPLSIRDVPDESGERKDIFEFLETTKALEESDTELYHTLINELNSKMTPRQKQLLDMLMSPTVYVEKFNQEYKPEKPATKLNYDIIGKMLGVSIATVTYELKKIQNLASEILNNIESSKKEQFQKKAEVIDTKCVKCGGDVDYTTDENGNITFKCTKCGDEQKLTRTK